MDLEIINETLKERGATHREDARRIGLFMAACQKKAISLDLNTLPEFAGDSSLLISAWANKAIDVAKNPLGNLNDPFKGLREDTRVFAETWDLDPVFREALG